MSNEPPDDDGDPPPGERDNLFQFKKPSGKSNREKAKASPLAAGNDDLGDFDPEVRRQIDSLGAPPCADPARLTVWQQSLTGVIAWAWAVGKIGPSQAARLKGMAEAVRTGGMVAVKAIDRDLLRKIAERLGMSEKPDDGLDPFPATDAAATRRSNRGRNPPR